MWSMRVGRLQCQEKGKLLHAHISDILYSIPKICMYFNRKAHPHQGDSVSQVNTAGAAV